MRFLASALLLLIAAPAPRAQISLTLQAGLQVSDLTETDPLVGEVDPSLDALVVNQKPRYGIRAGVGLSVPVAPGIAVRPEVVYAQKGNQLVYQVSFVDGITTSDRFYDDLEALAMLAVDVLKDDRITAGIEAGPAVVLRLGATDCRGPRPGPCLPVDDPGRVSLGAAVGAVVSAGVGGVGVRYTWGGRGTVPQGTEPGPTAETLAVSFRLRFR